MRISEVILEALGYPYRELKTRLDSEIQESGNKQLSDEQMGCVFQFLGKIEDKIKRFKDEDERSVNRIRKAAHILGVGAVGVFDSNTNKSSNIGLKDKGDITPLDLIKSGKYEHLSEYNNVYQILSDSGAYNYKTFDWLSESLIDTVQSDDVMEGASRDIISLYIKQCQFYKDILPREPKAEAGISGFMSEYTKSRVATEMHSKYEKGEPIFIPSGCNGHSVTLVAWGNFLSISNLGLGSAKDKSTFIVKLKKPLSQDDIIKILSAERHKDMSYINALVSELQGSKPEIISNRPAELYLEEMQNTVHTINSKKQKGGTCSFVSKKNAIHGALCIGKAMRTLFPEQPLFGEHVFGSAGEIELLSEVFQEGDVAAKSEYKVITSSIRDAEVKSLIDYIEEATESGIKPGSAKEFNVNYVVQKLISYVDTHDIRRNPDVKESILNRSKKIMDYLKSKSLLRVGPDLKRDKKILDANSIKGLYFRKDNDALGGGGVVKDYEPDISPSSEDRIKVKTSISRH